jgi:anti-sigma B factor antagonist
MTPLTVTARAVDGGHVLTVVGELDVATAPDFRAAYQKLALAEGDRLVLDLSGLTFCDSSGIATLINARNLAVANGAVFAVVAAPASIVRTFDRIGLGGFIRLYASLDQAQHD